MPLFKSRGLGPTVMMAEIVAIVALVFAVVGWFERSSDAAFADFVSTNESPVSEVVIKKVWVPATI